MLKASVFLLYCLAILTGVAGLFTGGVPLVRYMLARWHNPAVDFDNNFGFISTAGNIVILSLMLLIFVHVSHVVRGRFRPSLKKPVTAGKQQPDSSLSANSNLQPAETPKEQPAEETPDEKLARLINVKKE